ncbi:MAG: hypothetical protein U1F29_16170 [Planctomycetota bacterium]
MAYGTYQNERRYCAACTDYVPFLASPFACFCARCGGPSFLFSPTDMERFRDDVRASMSAPRGGVQLVRAAKHGKSERSIDEIPWPPKPSRSRARVVRHAG